MSEVWDEPPIRFDREKAFAEMGYDSEAKLDLDWDLLRMLGHSNLRDNRDPEQLGDMLLTEIERLKLSPSQAFDFLAGTR